MTYRMIGSVVVIESELALEWTLASCADKALRMPIATEGLEILYGGLCGEAKEACIGRFW